MFWLVGDGEARELPWRPGAVIFDVCYLWRQEPITLDIRDIHDHPIDTSLLAGRRAVRQEVREILGRVLQTRAVDYYTWSLLEEKNSITLG